MPDWMRLDTSSLNKASRERVRGVQINVLLSPHDVPTAVRGHYDQDLNRFVIEFRYIGDEKWTRLIQDTNISLRVGQHSRRLLGIEINVNALRAQAVGLQVYAADIVGKAIEQLAGGPQAGRREKNYRLVRDVISQRRDELFQSLESH